MMPRTPGSIAIVVGALFISWFAWYGPYLPEAKTQVADMRDELQHFVITIRNCQYLAYWTYSYDRSLRLIHAADCPNRDGHVFILSDGSITTRFGGKN